MPPEDDHHVYDDQKPKTGSSSEDPKTLHKNRLDGNGQDEHAAESREKIRGGEEAGDEGFYKPNGDESRKRALDQAHLSLSELAGSKEGTSFFNQAGDDGPKVMNTLKNTLKQRRKVMAGGGVAAGIGTIVLVTFFMLIPLKIEHVISNLERYFFATSEQAAEKETSILLRGYLRRALPSYKTCGSTVSKSCKVNISGNGPINNLYRTWSNNRLENKLAKDYGIEFKYNDTSKNWYLKAPGTNAGGDNIGPDGEGMDSDFQRADRAAMRSAVSDAMEGETRYKKVMYRYKVGRLLEEKYGIKRCITFCGTKDKLADKVDDQKKSATLFFVQRVLGLRENSIGIALKCMIDDGCDPTKTQPTDAEDGKNGELNGSPENSATDTAVREADTTAAQGFEAATGEQIAKRVSDIEDKGLGRVIFEEALTKAGLGSIAAEASAAVPIVGIVITASHVISFANHAGPVVQKLGYIVNSGTYAQTYQMYSTYADEVHTGKDTATEIGSFSNSLGPGNRGTAKNPQVGGTGGAEDSLWYQTVIDHENPQSSPPTALKGLMPGKAYADSSGSETCSGGSPIPLGDIVCPELVLGQSVAALDAAHSFLNIPVVGQVTFLADHVSGLANTLSSIFGSIITSIPGIGAAIQSASDVIAQVVQPFFMQAINVLIPNPVSLFMSGSRLFDVIAGGADVAGNLFAQVGMGGHKLTDAQFGQIVDAQQNEEQQQFQSQSFFARMFDTSSSYSLVSKVAMGIPFGLQADAQSGLASLINPLSAFSHGFGSMLSGKVGASTTTGADPIGVQRNGLTDADFAELERQINADGGDPQVWWDHNCSDNASYAYMKNNNWNENASKHTDPNTGMPEYDSPNFCLAMHTGIGIGGGYMDTSNLTSDDLADLPGATSSTGPTSTSPSPTSPSGLTNPFPKGWTPNRLDMGYDGTFKDEIVAPFSGTITYASTSFSNWGGYIELKADSKPSGLPTSTLYFAEGVKPTVTHGHVNAGQQIGAPMPSPWGDSYGTTSDGSGQIEWGLAQEGVSGSPTNTYVYGQCGSSAATQAVKSFAQWANKNLGVAPPSTTGNAGCP